MRAALGFIIAPLVGVLLPTIVSASYAYLKQPYEMHGLVLLVIPIAVAYMSALVFGVPVYFLFRRFGWFRLWQVVLASILCGMPFAIFEYIQTAMIYAPAETSIRWFVVVSVISALSGLSFWAVAFREKHEP